MILNPEQPERLLALAARCEAAKGPDRRIDADIAVAISGDADAWVVLPSPESMFSHQPGWYQDGEDKSRLAPAYTASLDAAMTLIPAQYRLGALLEFDGNGRWAAKLFNRGKPGGLPAAGGASAALALCAAALRAHAHSKESTHD